jgi:hypothetical protein
MESVSEFPRPYQVAKVAIASAITIGTKTLLIRSASLWIGAFSPWAVKTILVMRASSVSLPTLFASITIGEFRLIAPAITLAPA